MRRLPIPALLVLSVAAFTTLSTEILPAGLLSLMDADLGVPEARVGLLVTVYAVASAVCAIPLVAATRRVPRRLLLVIAVSVILVANLVTALAGSYEAILVARGVAGAASGLTWAMVTGYAARIVPAEGRGRALAIVLAGSTVALAAGVPAATALAHLIGWQPTFLALSALGLSVVLAASIVLPVLPGATDARERMPIRDLITHRGVRPILIATFAFLLGHGLLYTYIAPFSQAAGLGRNPAGLLLAFGLAAIAGIWLTGVVVDAHLRSTLLFGIVIVLVAMVVLGTIPGLIVATTLAVAAWGFVFGGVPTVFQTALMHRVPPHEADLASSVLITVYNGGLAAGSLLGVVLLDSIAATELPWVAAVGFTAALVIAVSARAAFPPPAPILRQ